MIRSIVLLVLIALSSSVEAQLKLRVSIPETNFFNIKGNKIISYLIAEKGFNALSEINRTKPSQTLNKILYISSILLASAHWGLVDALRWEKTRDNYPDWLKSDVLYLGGAFASGVFIAITSTHWDYEDFSEFILTSVGTVFLGSVVWDIVFGSIRYKDAFYPYHKWFYNMGFADKRQRITFDILRIFLGATLLYLSDRLDQKEINNQLDRDLNVQLSLIESGLGLTVKMKF